MTVSKPKQLESPIDSSLAQLIDLLKANEAIKTYQALEKKVNETTDIKKLEEEIKDYQRQATHFEYYQKPNAKKVTDEEIDRETSELATIPLVKAYRHALAEANDLVEMVTESLTEQVNQAISVSEQQIESEE